MEIYRGYEMKLDFQVESGDRSLLGRIRGTLDQLISRAHYFFWDLRLYIPKLGTVEYVERDMVSYWSLWKGHMRAQCVGIF